MQVLKTQGTGSPVLLLHGSPSAPEAFAPLAEALASEHRVLIGALPGYAGVPPVVPFGFDRVHTGIEDALLRETREPVDLVGFSLGAYNVLSVALRGRVPVRSVVCLSGLFGIPDELRPAYRDLAGAIRAGAVAPDTFVPRMLSEAYVATHPEAVETVRGWLGVTTLDVIADELAAMADAPNLLPRLRDADLRLLVRAGALDAATPPSWSEALAGACRGAVLEVVPGAGHALLVEDAVGTRDSVVRFLAG